MRRIGIIGGSFNPIHDGHVHIMDEAYERIGLDEVWMWISHNIFKDPSTYAPIELRRTLCDQHTKDRPWLKPQDFESAFHDTRTASSMRTLKEMFPETEFIWVFGDDNFASFHTWDDVRYEVDGQKVPDWQYILHNFSVAVMHRQGYREDARNGIAAKYGATLQMDDPTALSTRRRGWSFVNNDTMAYSSTAIKEQLRAGKTNVEGLSTDAENFIRDRGLYRLNNEFKNNVLPHSTNHDVRIETFLLLANTANLAKSAVAHNLANMPYEVLKQQFSQSWDEAHARGKIGMSALVPAGLSYCAQASQDVAVAQSLDGRSTSLSSALLRSMGRLATLCVYENLEKHRAMQILDLIFEAPDLTSPDKAFTTNRNVLAEYALAIGEEPSMILKTLHKIKEGAPYTCAHRKPENS